MKTALLTKGFSRLTFLLISPVSPMKFISFSSQLVFFQKNNVASHYALRHHLPVFLEQLVYISLAFLFSGWFYFFFLRSHTLGSLLLSMQLFLVASWGSSSWVPKLWAFCSISIGPNHSSCGGCTLGLRTRCVLGTSVARGIGKSVGSRGGKHDGFLEVPFQC